MSEIYNRLQNNLNDIKKNPRSRLRRILLKKRCNSINVWLSNKPKEVLKIVSEWMDLDLVVQYRDLTT